MWSEKKRSEADELTNDVGRELYKVQGYDALYCSTQSHQKQQTEYKSFLTLSCENAKLRGQILSVTCGTKMIEGNNKTNNTEVWISTTS